MTPEGYRLERIKQGLKYDVYYGPKPVGLVQYEPSFDEYIAGAWGVNQWSTFQSMNEAVTWVTSLHRLGTQ